MSHTPGPWFAAGRVIEDAHGNAIAMVNLAAPDDVAHANANLIAAAPDLLRLAIDVQWALNDLDDFTEIEALGSKARAAIAKAEGKSCD